jgi:UDP-glucose 4-epimerase
MAILVTGGAGYIGSHCVKILCDKNYEVVAIDNLIKGHEQALKISNAKFYHGNINDKDLLNKIFTENKIDGVMHFAAYSLVAESEKMPYEYYNNNVAATLMLLNCMVENNIKNIVFSSTASTYGIPKKMPVLEDDEQRPINTYGETKLAIEKMLACFERAHDVKYINLRYFNVAGAYKTGEIGEDHNPETHLIPIILQVANGKRDKIQIFGGDYQTPDGTNIRDYIHIEDLIKAHIKALEYLKRENKSDYFNLGSGGGYSNLEVVNAARKVTGHAIPLEITKRRPGDPDILVASSEKAEKILGWTREYKSIESIIESAWKWHKNNINGYQK